MHSPTTYGFPHAYLIHNLVARRKYVIFATPNAPTEVQQLLFNINSISVSAHFRIPLNIEHLTNDSSQVDDNIRNI